MHNKLFTKIIVLLLLAFGLMVAGCDTTKLPQPTAPKTPETKQQTTVPPTETKASKLVVYRVPTNGDQQVIAERVSYDKTGKTEAQAALEALLSTKPASKSLQNVFPKGTALKSVRVEKGICYADFNKAFAQKGQGSYNEMMMVNAVVATLTEIPTIKRVQILVEGQKIATISGHTDLLDPLTRTPDMIKKN